MLQTLELHRSVQRESGSLQFLACCSTINPVCHPLALISQQKQVADLLSPLTAVETFKLQLRTADTAYEPDPSAARSSVNDKLQEIAELFATTLTSLRHVDLYLMDMSSYDVYREDRDAGDSLQSITWVVLSCVTDDVVC